MMKKFTVLGTILLVLCLCLTACTNNTPDPVVGDPALLEFPGLKWGMTPDEVIEALDLKQDQILENSMYVPNENMEPMEYDNWNLFATELSFLSSDVESALFAFIRFPGHDFALTHISLNLPNETDMNALVNSMTKIYGVGSTESAPFYRFENGELVADSSEITVEKYKYKEGFPYYLYSPIKGSEYLPAEVLERYADLYTKVNPEISRELVLEYLDTQPLVKISCLARETMKYGKGSPSDPYDHYNVIKFSASNMIDILQRFGK